MAQFVNYKKRNFTLPLGCKDLIDLLVPSRRQTKGRSPPPDIKEERFATCGMSEIGRCVSILLQPRRKFSLVTVTSQQLHFSVRLYRFRDEPLGAIALLNEDTPREQAVRTFFERQGMDYIHSASRAAHGVGCLVYPLPSEASGVIRLTTELLRSVYGMSDEAGLDFYCYED